LCAETLAKIFPPSGNIVGTRANYWKISEIRKKKIIFSSTQPKEEFGCAFFGESWKLHGNTILPSSTGRQKEAAKSATRKNIQVVQLFFHKRKKILK